MASKRKLNGSSSIRMVEQAIREAGADVITFFAQAAQAAKAFDVVVTREARRFRLFQADGLVKYPDYRLPVWVMNFAETVRGHRSPATFFKNLPRIAWIENAAKVN